jgi:uncharacterized protein (DUF2267 family)
MFEQVKTTIIEYLAGLTTANELAVSLPDGWDFDEATEADREARRLTLRTLGSLAEYQRGDRTEAELDEALRDLLLDEPAKATGTTLRVKVQRFTAEQSSGARRAPQAAVA